MVYDYKIEDEILKKMIEEEKFLKKDMNKIIKEVMKSFGLKKIRGMKREDVLGKVNSDGSIIIFEISKFDNLFDYWILLFDNTGNLIYEEADGEINNKNKIYRYYEYLNSIDIKNDSVEDIRKKIFYPNY